METKKVNMASVIGILLVGIFTMTAPSSAEFITVECQNSAGHFGQPSKLYCMVKAKNGLSITISRVYWKKNGHMVVRFDGTLEAEERFQLADPNWSKSNDISLLVKDTQISDGDNYSCTVVTNRGISGGDATLSVKANYSKPVITSKPAKNMKEDEKVALTCTASGGYPRGAIHWFDAFGTNWTRSAETSVSETEDKRLTMQSTYLSGDTSYAPYKCVVLNSEWKEESNTTLHLDTHLRNTQDLSVETKHIAAAVVVIGSLICGLLAALLLCRRRSQHHDHLERYGPDPEAQELNPPPYEEVDKDPALAPESQ